MCSKSNIFLCPSTIKEVSNIVLDELHLMLRVTGNNGDNISYGSY